MRRLTRIRVINVTVVEFILSYISIGWACVLFANPDLFYTNASFYQFQNFIVHEWILGAIALACALVKLVGMALGSTMLRKAGLIMSTLFWIMISTSILVASGEINFATGFIVYSGLAVMSLWTSKEVVKSDRI